MTTHVDIGSGRVTATCDTCHTTGHRVTDMRTVRVTTPTGDWGYGSTWGRHPDGPSYRRVSKRCAYPIAVAVTRTVCPGCGHRIDAAVRRGVCTARDVRE